ncbi:MAG: ParB/RepB/Spo0J family partition protein [Defluviitaleaceae bacterium]|nr:ParB/RepB/Spo0J family partition protein [Defluviitaleaceae bacterium]
MKKKSLGRGLGALLDGASSQIADDTGSPTAQPKAAGEATATGGVLVVDIRKVEPNPTQPRQFFDEASLEELAVSMKAFGIVQPLLVTEAGGLYTIIAGERRYRAARIAGLKEVPVIVKDYTEMEILQVAILENIQRQDLTSIEEANCYKRLMDDFFFSADDIAIKLGKNKHSVISALHLLELSRGAQELAAQGKITASHAKILLSVEDPDLQLACAEKIVKDGLSVRGAETMVQQAIKQAAKDATGQPSQDDPATTSADQAYAYRQAEEEMKTILGSQVHIRPGKKKGKIEVEYYTTGDLDRILDMIRQIPMN